VERIERCGKTRIHRCIKSTRKEESETRLYIISSEACVEVIGKGIRSYWGIETKLHWQLDVSFSEDQSRKRDGYAAQNFSLLNAKEVSKGEDSIPDGITIIF
jgi:predicted transposase YbfD/YdcC